MPAKETINRVLSTATGYHLTKGAPGTPSAEESRLRLELKRTRAELATARKAAVQKPPRKKAAEFPRDYDDEMRDIIRAVRPYTMTDRDRLHALVSSVRYLVKHKVPGDFVECGVWRGGSMHAAARTLTACGDQSRELYLFDTYEGMPPPTDKDIRQDGQTAEHLLATKDKDQYIWAIASLEDVQEGFEQVPYPAERVHFVQGKVEDTIPEGLPERIALLRLDTDWYESTAHELTHAYERLVPGGVLIIDDYGHWAGSKLATDEFLERTDERLLMVRAATGRVAVKPWA